MGPPELQPPPPRFAWTEAPATHRHVSKVIEECNWLQALEGGIDTSHAPILHRTITANTTRPGVNVRSAFVRGSAPKLEVDLTDYGYRYFGVRQLPEGGVYVRGYHYIMPFTQLRPAQIGFNGSRPGQAEDESTMRVYAPGHYWVPMDDHSCMVWNFTCTYGAEPLGDDDRL